MGGPPGITGREKGYDGNRGARRGSRSRGGILSAVRADYLSEFVRAVGGTVTLDRRHHTTRA
ncbi:unnamed protein product, partial [Laminaria digitata]